MNFTTNRVQPEQIEHTDPPSVEDYEYTRLELACDCYRIYRNNGFSRWEALRHFFNALKGSV